MSAYKYFTVVDLKDHDVIKRFDNIEDAQKFAAEYPSDMMGTVSVVILEEYTNKKWIK